MPVEIAKSVKGCCSMFGTRNQTALATWLNAAVLLFALPCALPAQNTATKPVLVSAKKIWDAAPHNAFTDLVRHNDRWYCVFREGKRHVSPDGALRVITSEDGTEWKSAALITSATSDLRDAKITVTPKGQLMLSGAEAVPNADYTHQSLTWFSWDGLHWTDSNRLADKDVWLWRTTWAPDKSAYGFGYLTNNKRGLRFYKSNDGKKCETLVEKAGGLGTYPNETDMVFLRDGTAYCLLRQDGEPNHGLIGKSKPPYKDWTWKDLGVRIGGPAMIRLPNGRYFATVRLYDNPVRTSLCELDPENAKLTEVLKLPSGGDTSYAGMAWHKNQLWISYYSSHEKKTCIYLARVGFE